MSLTHAVLGLLALRPRTGYEVVAEFNGDLGRWAWQAGYSSVYPELHRMTESQLIAVTGEGPRGSIIYSITDAGRRELQSWMLDPPKPRRIRNGHALQLFLVSTLEPTDARLVLERITAEAEDAATALRTIRAEQTDSGDAAAFGLLAAEFGLRLNETIIDWARWARKHLAAQEPASD